MNSLISPLRFAGAAVVATLLVSRVLAQVTVLSSPVGVMVEKPRCEPSGYAFPLIGGDLFVGVASSNTATSIVFPDADGAIGADLIAGGRYFVEIATGPLEGERLDVDAGLTMAGANAAIALEFGDDTHSTLSSLPADALAGARCILRRHVTLADLPDMFSPALAGEHRGHHGSRGDGVMILGSRGFERYRLDVDGVSWRDEDERHGGEWGRRHRTWCGRHRHPEPTDYRDMVIPPDVSVIIDVNSGAKTWTHDGIVRTNAFRKNLVRGMQAFASGFPMDLSPVQIGAFVDPAAPAATRWTGSNILPFADQIEVLCSQRKPLELYFLRGDGHTWQTLARSMREDMAGKPILGDTDMILLRRRNPDAAYVIVPPFEL